MTKKKSITINTLARMMQKEFLATRHEIRSDITERFNKVDNDIVYLHNSFNMLDKKIDKIAEEIKEIKTQLEKVVYRPELQALERRIAVLEKKFGIG